MTPTQTYQRPELSQAEEKLNAKLALDIVRRKKAQDVIMFLTAVLCENQRLTAEVNEHRGARGFELLPVYDAPKS